METIEWKGEKREINRVSQYEVEYREYDWQGNKIGEGTEDFSAERYENVKNYRVFAWDGKTYNKGGFRWHEEVLNARVESRKRKALAEIASIWYPTAASICVR